MWPEEFIHWRIQEFEGCHMASRWYSRLWPLLSVLTLRILKRHILTPNKVFWAIVHQIPLRIVVCSLINETRKEKTQTRTKKVFISPTWGDASLKPIATKFGNSLYLIEVINRSKFGVDWYSSFGSGEVQRLPFPIGMITGPYHCSATALRRMHVI